MEKYLLVSSEQVQYLIKKDKRLGKVIVTLGDIPFYIRPNTFESLVHTIINQMLSNKVASIIFERLYNICNQSVDPNAILSLKNDDLRAIGISNSKIAYIKGLALSIVNGDLELDKIHKLNDDEIVKILTSFKGFGKWSAKMYLIFTLGRNDVLPYEDGAFLQSYRWLYKKNDDTIADIMKRCRKWKPYSSIAARYLYFALDSGLTKKEFHLYKE